MARTLSEEYGRLKAELDELRSQEDLYLGETEREVLNENISRLQNQIAQVRNYVMQSEDLAYQVVALNRKINKNEHYIEELEEIIDTRIEHLDESSPVDVAEQAMSQEARFLEIIAEANNLKPRDLRDTLDDAENRWDALMEYYYTLSENTYSLSVQRNRALSSLRSLKDTAMGIDENEEFDDEPLKIPGDREFDDEPLQIPGDREFDDEPLVIPNDEEFDGEPFDFRSRGTRTDDDFELDDDLWPEVWSEDSDEFGFDEDFSDMDMDLDVMQMDLREINDARALKNIVAQRKEKWEKVSELKGVKLAPGKEFRDNKSQIKDLQDKIKSQDAFLRDFVYEFSKDPSYEKSEELISLIGIRDESRDKRDGNFGTTLVKPTVKQHLEPILEIDEKLKDTTLSDKDREKLEKEKAQKERRLGKKWLIKLKMDKLQAEIDEINAKLKNPNLTPEEKAELEAKLKTKTGELSSLQKEYGEILEQIAEMISDTVEKKVLERNGVASLEELEQKISDKREENQREAERRRTTMQRDEEPEQEENNEVTRSGERIIGEIDQEQPVVPTGTRMAGAPAGQPIGGGSSYGSVGNGNNSQNLPAKKPSLKERIANIFKKKEKAEEQETDWENGGNVVKSVEMEYDFASQYAEMPPSKVEGEFFYFTREREGKLEYVEMPLKDIKCTKKDLIKEIKRLQEEHKGRDYIRPNVDDNRSWLEKLDGRSIEEILEDQSSPAEDFRLKRPGAIANHLLGISRGKERDLRTLNAICQLRAAHLTKEVDEAMFGAAEYQFTPGVQMDGKEMTFVPLDRTSDDFKKLVGKINKGVPVRGSRLQRQEHESPDNGEVDLFMERSVRDFEDGPLTGSSRAERTSQYDPNADLYIEDENGRIVSRVGVSGATRTVAEEDLVIPDEPVYKPFTPRVRVKRNRRSEEYEESTDVQATGDEQDKGDYDPATQVPKMRRRNRENERPDILPSISYSDDEFVPLLDENDDLVLPEEEMPVSNHAEAKLNDGLSEKGRQLRRNLNPDDIGSGKQAPPQRRSTSIPKRREPSRNNDYTVPVPEGYDGPIFRGKAGAPNLDGKAPVLTGKNITGGSRSRTIKNAKKQQNDGDIDFD